MDLIRGIEAKPRQTARQEGKVKKGMTEYGKVPVEVGLKAGNKARQTKIHSFHGNLLPTVNILSPF